MRCISAHFIVGLTEEKDDLMHHLKILREVDGQHGFAFAWAALNPQQPRVSLQQRSICFIVLDPFTCTSNPISLRTDESSALVFWSNRNESVQTYCDLLLFC